ncbi:MAG: MoaD/ThiS family protein [Anaerolineae bacterium]|nr:MoaD/ThiS family protein [Anaerolineae bacterium]
MELTVEFAGLSRVLTHLSRITLEVEPDTSYRQILAILSDKHPELLGEVIHSSKTTLQSSNMLNVNGKHMVQPNELDQYPVDGDRLIMMSILAGG